MNDGASASPPTARVIIVGVGGFGREVIDIVDDMSASGAPVELAGSVDDGDVDLDTLCELGVTYLGTTDALAASEGAYAIAIGDGAVRRAIVDRLPDACTPVALQHPAATVGGRSSLGPGSILGSGARLATHVTVGAGALVGAGAIILQGLTIGEYATVGAGAVVTKDVPAGVTVIGVAAQPLPAS